MAVDAVIVIAYDGTDRFLMVHHSRRGWELPGGRPRPGETPEDTARRELLEETGHALLGPRHVGDVKGPGGRVAVVRGTAGEAAQGPAPGEAVVEVRFVARLSDVAPLSFPDDPVDDLQRLLGRPLA